MIVWRFLQGLLLPPIFAVAIAYVGDEWPVREVPTIAGIYITGASIGGFCGRLVPGVLTDLIGWRSAFVTLAVMSLAGAVVVLALLPRERSFVRSEGLAASARQMLRHLRNPQLVATYAIGFGVLFNFIAVFTYVSFHLAAPPYLLSPTMLGAIFVTYLAGSATAPMIGWAMVRFGRRPFVLGVLAIWACGALLLLAPPLAVIIAGLRQGGPLLRGRALRDGVLHWRQHGRAIARPHLGRRRLAGLRRHGDRGAGHHDRDRRPRLSARGGLISATFRKQWVTTCRRQRRARWTFSARSTPRPCATWSRSWRPSAAAPATPSSICTARFPICRRWSATPRR
jgi:MFS family permease